MKDAAKNATGSKGSELSPDELAEARASAYVLGELELEEGQAFERELADDPGLQERVEALRSLSARLGSAYAAMKPEGALPQGSTGLLASGPHLRSPSGAAAVGSPQSVPPFAWLRFGAAAAALALVSLVAWQIALRPERSGVQSSTPQPVPSMAPVAVEGALPDASADRTAVGNDAEFAESFGISDEDSDRPFDRNQSGAQGISPEPTPARAPAEATRRSERAGQPPFQDFEVPSDGTAAKLGTNGGKSSPRPSTRPAAEKPALPRPSGSTPGGGPGSPGGPSPRIGGGPAPQADTPTGGGGTGPTSVSKTPTPSGRPPAGDPARRALSNGGSGASVSGLSPVNGVFGPSPSSTSTRNPTTAVRPDAGMTTATPAPNPSPRFAPKPGGIEVVGGSVTHSTGVPGQLSGESADDADAFFGGTPPPEAQEQLRRIWERKQLERRRSALPPVQHHAFSDPLEEALCTFALDVDRAGLSHVRRALLQGQFPHPSLVRVEELVNAFKYDDAAPEAGSETPFAVHMDLAESPWGEGRLLARVGLRAKDVAWESRPPCNLVFLVDVSGSMSAANKLPLVKRGLRTLVAKLDARDRVSLVTYASGSKLALAPTAGDEQETILAAIDALTPGGGTNGARGLELAYQHASANRLAEGSNRVVLCSDGDFNVGPTDENALLALIGKHRDERIYLSVLGFGMQRRGDHRMETLADRGNGLYAYVDSPAESERVFAREAIGTLLTVARDVKFQVEFNPARVLRWRQVGYENRAMAHTAFRNDRVDGGELGAGHSVVAFYELVPHGSAVPGAAPKLRYQPKPEPELPAAASASKEWLTASVRWQAATASGPSRLVVQHLADEPKPFAEASRDFRFGSAVAGLALTLRGTPHLEGFTLASALRIAEEATGADAPLDRKALVDLIRAAIAASDQPR